MGLMMANPNDKYATRKALPSVLTPSPSPFVFLACASGIVVSVVVGVIPARWLRRSLSACPC